MSTTPNLNLPLPDPTADVDDEFFRLQQTLILLDTILSVLQTAVNGKSPLGHTHTQAQVTGLVTALANKMDASKTFKLIDLIDVLGASNAAAGYLLQKTSNGFGFTSPAAALGNHQHSTADIAGLTDLIQSYITALVDSSPAALNTLKELANALGNDPNFATSVTNALAGRLLKSGDTMTGALGLAGFATNEFKAGNADAASYTQHNFIMRGWWGMGMAAHDNTVNGYYDFRAGLWDVKGGFKVNGNLVPHGGNKATAADITSGTENKFPDAKAVKDGIAANAPQPFTGPYTQVSLARDTPRQNTTGKPLFVSIQCSGNSNYGGNVWIFAGTPAGGYVQVSTVRGAAANDAQTAYAVIAPGEYYKWNNNGLIASVTIWEKS